MDAAAEDGPHTIEAFLHTAQQRGERAVTLARMVACAAFLAVHLPSRVGLLAVGDLKSWLIVTSLVVGLGFSVMALRWSRAGTVTPARLHLSVVVDALVVYVTLGSAVAWPHANYGGIIREHELVIVHLAVIASGIRLSVRGAQLGVGLHALGLAGCWWPTGSMSRGSPTRRRRWCSRRRSWSARRSWGAAWRCGRASW